MIREYIYFVDDNPNGTSGMTEEEVVRCKDCKHHGMANCPVWEGHITDDYMWCYFGERSEE